MAENKKGFILYADQIELFKQLPNEKAGQLIKHIFSYVNDENPTTEDLLLNLAFTPIKQQLKRDLDKYKGVKEKKSISGREGNLKRWSLDLYNDYKKGICTLIQAESIAEGRKVSHTDKVPSQKVANIAVTVKDNVKDNVNDKYKDIKKENKKNRLSDFEIFWNIYDKKEGRKDVEKKFLSLPQKDVDKILKVVKNYIDSVDVKWKKLPKTWLNGEHWNDEVKSNNKNNSNKPKKPTF